MRYTAIDNETGEKIKFEWHDSNPPTDDDILEVQAAYRQSKPTTRSEDVQQMVSEFDPNKPTLGKQLYEGAKGGLKMTARGIQQKLAEFGEGAGMVDTPTVQNITRKGLAEREALNKYTQENAAARAGKFIGETAPSMLIPGGVSGGALKRALTASLAGGAQGAMKFTGPEESIGENVALGAFGGGVSSLGLSGAGKVFNALNNRFVKPEARMLGEKFNIPTTLGEEIKNPHVVRAETWMERIPFVGIKGFREKQHKASEDASKQFLSKYVVNPEEARGALGANREYVDSLYQGVKTQLAPYSGLKAYALETSRNARELLDRFPETFKQFPDRKVEGILLDFQSGAGKVHSFDDLWELRKGIGNLVGQAKKKLQSGDVNETQYSLLSKLYNSTTKDLDTFSNQIGQPQIKIAFKEANDAYKQYVVKYSILERAFDKVAGEEGAGKVFSPQRFSNELNKILVKDKYYGSFSEAEKKEMAGLANILSIVKRAGQYAENPPTGARLAEPGAVMYMAGLAKTVPYAVMAKFLSTTSQGKNLVLAASKIEPENPAMKALINQAYKLASRSMAQGAINLEEKQ